MARTRATGAARPLPPPSATYSTREVAEHFELPQYILLNAIRDRRIPSPPRNSIGRLAWSAADIDRARVALAATRRRTTCKSRRGGKAVPHAS
jgi:hypothetical protein